MTKDTTMPTQIMDTIQFERATQATRELAAYGRYLRLLADLLSAAGEPLERALDAGTEELARMADRASAEALAAMRTLLPLRLVEVGAAVAGAANDANEALYSRELVDESAFATAAELLGQLREACRR